MIIVCERLEPAFILVFFTFRLPYTRSRKGPMSVTELTVLKVCP